MGYKLARFLMVLAVRLFTHLEAYGEEHAPSSGAYIIAANHLGRLDPLFVYYFLDRKDIILMVAEKYRKYAPVRWFVKQLDAMWVDRFNADFAAMRQALKRLKQGQVLVLAPEGTRSKSGSLLEGRSGASYLAAKAGVPIIPVALAGSEDKMVLARLKRFKRPHVVIRAGEPFTLPPLSGINREEELKSYTDEIMCRIAALLPPSYRGFYTEHPRLKELLGQSTQPAD